MIAIISNVEVLIKPRTQKFGKILIEATSINPVGEGYNIGISDYAVTKEIIETVEDYQYINEAGETVNGTEVITNEVENFEFLESKNVFIPREGVDLLYESIPPENLVGLTFSERDKLTKSFALLSYIQSDLLDGSESTIYGLLPENWIIHGNTSKI